MVKFNRLRRILWLQAKAEEAKRQMEMQEMTVQDLKELLDSVQMILYCLIL